MCIVWVGLLFTWHLYNTGQSLSEFISSVSALFGNDDFLSDAEPAFDARTSESAQPLRVIKDSNSDLNSIGMRSVPIPAGTFMMGDADDAADEVPHQVTLTHAFEMSAFELTREQFQTVMNPGLRKEPDGQKPVIGVSWDLAVEFCTKLSDLPAEKTAGYVYRLPTEAEWEYACRSGSNSRYSFGDDESRMVNHGWYRANSPRRTQAVGLKKPNAWGLYDMYGNAFEWCQDGYAEFPSEPVIGPASLERRIVRGGA